MLEGMNVLYILYIRINWHHQGEGGRGHSPGSTVSALNPPRSSSPEGNECNGLPMSP